VVPKILLKIFGCVEVSTKAVDPWGESKIFAIFQLIRIQNQFQIKYDLEKKLRN